MNRDTQSACKNSNCFTNRLIRQLEQPLPSSQYPLLHELFEKQVATTPEAIAIEYERSAITYRDLLGMVDKMRCDLSRFGVDKGDVIALWADNTPLFVVSVMAIMKAGAVFTVLTRTDPESRVEEILDMSNACLIVDCGGEVLTDASCYISPNERYQEPDEKTESSISKAKISADDPAYILFTSGSTGKPKGIVGAHRGISHFLSWIATYIGVKHGDRIFHATGLAFDAIFRGLFAGLTKGATICFRPRGSSLLTEDVLPWMRTNRITIVHSIPSIVSSWLRVSFIEETPGVRCLFLGGEALTSTVVNRWFERVNANTEIVSIYGATETVLGKCVYKVPGARKIKDNVTLPAGSPIEGAQWVVFNQDGAICEVGEIGEVAIRTPYRSLGYLNNPELTESRFKNNPLSDDDNDIIYFTGDEGKYDSDGCLYVLGRIDEMVKVGGIRIELDEIRACLSQTAGVDQCEVVVEKNDYGVSIYAAVVIRQSISEKGSVLQEIRTRVSKELVPNARPSRIKMVDSLPLMANGKLDRRELLIKIKNETEPGYVGGGLAAIVRKAIKDVSGVMLLEDGASLFEQGISSLQLLLIASRLESDLGKKVRLESIVKNPTVNSLAIELNGEMDESGFTA
ncbi:MAG: non-ribosomal peptide synthetase [Ketobacteraceae bacterium]|nr:non-ribosomal peptide synthetase [Ketobacteraceae bacterium]